MGEACEMLLLSDQSVIVGPGTMKHIQSATDDIIWGVFQSSFVLLDQTIGKAMAYGWLLFLLTILEEAILNPKLNKKQRLKRLGWIVVTGYYSGRLVLPDWNVIAGENASRSEF